MIARGRGRRRRGSSCCTEMYSTGFSMKTDRIAEPVDGPSVQFLVEQARAHGVWVCGRCPSAPTADAQPYNQLVLAAPDGTTHRYAKIHPFSYGREHEHYAAGDRLPHRRRSKACAARSSSATTCASPTSSGRSRRDTDCYVVARELARGAPRALDDAAARPRDREPGVRRRRQPRRPRAASCDYAGDSMIIDPFGEIVRAGGRRRDDHHRRHRSRRASRTVRAEYPFLQDRR